MTKKEVLQAAETIKIYCKSKPVNCTGCVFDRDTSKHLFVSACMLNDHLPETWELEKISGGRK